MSQTEKKGTRRKKSGPALAVLPDQRRRPCPPPFLNILWKWKDLVSVRPNYPFVNLLLCWFLGRHYHIISVDPQCTSEVWFYGIGRGVPNVSCALFHLVAVKWRPTSSSLSNESYCLEYNFGFCSNIDKNKRYYARYIFTWKLFIVDCQWRTKWREKQ